MAKYRLVTVTIIQTPYLDVFISWSSDYEITVLRLKIETLYLRRTCTHYVYRPSPLYGSVQGNQSPHPSYRESSVIPAEMALPLRRSRNSKVSVHFRRTCTHYVYRPSPLYGSVQGNQSPHPSYRESSVIPAEMALPLRRSRKVSVHFRITFGPLFQRQSWFPSFHIHHFHTKILQKHCFQFLLGLTVVTTKIEDDT